MSDADDETLLARAALWERGLRKLSDPTHVQLVWSMIERLKQRRIEVGLRQEDVAKSINMPLRSYQKVETGVVPVPPDRLLDLSRTLGVSPSWFVLGRVPQSDAHRALTAEIADLSEAAAQTLLPVVRQMTQGNRSD